MEGGKLCMKFRPHFYIIIPLFMASNNFAFYCANAEKINVAATVNEEIRLINRNENPIVSTNSEIEIIIQYDKIYYQQKKYLIVTSAF